MNQQEFREAIVKLKNGINTELENIIWEIALSEKEPKLHLSHGGFLRRLRHAEEVIKHTRRDLDKRLKVAK